MDKNMINFIRSRFMEELSNQGDKQINASQIRGSLLRDGINRPDPKGELYFSSRGFLYIHVSTNQKGVWGLRKDIIDDLNIMGIPYTIVLLKSRHEENLERNKKFVADGYIIKKLGEPPIKRFPNLDSSGKDYKINEPGDLDEKAMIFSIQDVARQIASFPSIPFEM